MAFQLFRPKGVSIVSTKPGAFAQFTLSLLPNIGERGVTFDITDSENEEHSWDVPEHPVAAGFVIADSRKKLPTAFTVSGTFSATPLSVFSTAFQAFGSIVRPDIRAFESLLQIAKDNPKVFVVTEEGVLPNMSITKVRRIKDPDGGNAIAVAVSFREIRTVFGTVAEAVVDQESTQFGAAGEIAGGQQSPVPVDDSTAVAGGLGELP